MEFILIAFPFLQLISLPEILKEKKKRDTVFYFVFLALAVIFAVLYVFFDFNFSILQFISEAMDKLHIAYPKK